MADLNVTTDDWVSINNLAPFDIGSRIKIQNQTTKYLRIVESITKPDIEYFGGELITTLHISEPSKSFAEGGKELWLRNSKKGTGKISVFLRGTGSLEIFDDDFSDEFL